MTRLSRKSYNRMTAITVLASLFIYMFSSMSLPVHAATVWDSKNGIYLGTERTLASDILRSVQLIPSMWQGAKASHDAGYGWLSGAIDGSIMALNGEYFSTPGQAYNIVSDRYTTGNDNLLGASVDNVSSIPSDTPNMYYSYTGDTHNSTTNNNTTNYKVFNDLSSHDTYNYQWYNPITNDYNYTDYFYYDYDYNTYYYNYTQNNFKYDYFYTDNRTYNTFYIIQTDQETGEEVEFLYNIFFKLPDGRSSYNLKKEDVWGQYLLYNTRPYELVAEDDGKTLGLWHFDQDLYDSSYWNNSVGTCGNLQYSEGMFETGKYIAPSTDIALNLPLDKCDFDASGAFTLEWVENIPNNANVRIHTYNTDDILKNTTQETLVTGDIRKNYYYNHYDYFDDHIFDRYLLPDHKYVNIRPYLGVNTYYAITFDGSGYTFFINGIKQDSQVSDLNTELSASLGGNAHSGKDSTLYLNTSDFRGIQISDDSIRFKADEFLYLTNGRFIEQVRFDASSSGMPGSARIYYSYRDSYEYDDFRSYSHWGSVIDEMRLSRGLLYTDDYSPSAEPYTTNMVLALPEDPQENEIYFYTGYAYIDFRVGGVRPTYPGDGYIYIYLEDDIVKSVQQYQANKWVEITATIYKDGSAHDLVNYSLSDYKLHDLDRPDIGDPTSSPAPGEPTSTPAPGEPTPTPEPGSNNDDGDDKKDNWFTDILGNVGDFFGGVGKQLISFITDTLFGMILELFTAVLGLLSDLLGMIKDSFTTVLGFLNGDFAEFLASAFVFIPKEIWDVILLGMKFSVLAAVIKALISLFRG